MARFIKPSGMEYATSPEGFLRIMELIAAIIVWVSVSFVSDQIVDATTSSLLNLLFFSALTYILGLACFSLSYHLTHKTGILAVRLELGLEITAMAAYISSLCGISISLKDVVKDVTAEVTLVSAQIKFFIALGYLLLIQCCHLSCLFSDVKKWRNAKREEAENPSDVSASNVDENEEVKSLGDDAEAKESRENEANRKKNRDKVLLSREVVTVEVHSPDTSDTDIGESAASMVNAYLVERTLTAEKKEDRGHSPKKTVSWDVPEYSQQLKQAVRRFRREMYFSNLEAMLEEEESKETRQNIAISVSEPAKVETSPLSMTAFHNNTFPEEQAESTLQRANVAEIEQKNVLTSNENENKKISVQSLTETSQSITENSESNSDISNDGNDSLQDQGAAGSLVNRSGISPNDGIREQDKFAEPTQEQDGSHRGIDDDDDLKIQKLTTASENNERGSSDVQFADEECMTREVSSLSN